MSDKSSRKPSLNPNESSRRITDSKSNLPSDSISNLDKKKKQKLNKRMTKILKPRNRTSDHDLDEDEFLSNRKETLKFHNGVVEWDRDQKYDPFSATDASESDVEKSKPGDKVIKSQEESRNDRRSKFSQRKKDSTVTASVVQEMFENRRETTIQLSLEQFIERMRMNGNQYTSYDKIEDILYDMFYDSEAESVNIQKFISAISDRGIKYKSDPRLKKLRYNIEIVEHYLMTHMNDADDSLTIDRDLFQGMILDEIDVLTKIFKDGLAIPDFVNFTKKMKTIFKKISKISTKGRGNLADYIPQLSRQNREWFGVSICTIDGQRWNIGDTKIPYTVQSTCKPINYALALTEYDSKYVHKFVGKEPSGASFNKIVLDKINRPHNPMINAGAIMVTSLIRSDLAAADRFDWLHQKYTLMTGGEHLGFNNAVYLSEKKEGHRNYALGHYMKESKSFPDKTNLHETLDFYFQSCSLEVTCESHAVIAATLANSGICPTSGEQILSQESVRKCLSLMLSCGMYDYSGQFAFDIGIPAKSGVSGCVILVIPGVCGISLFSPPLDECGNSVRGIDFCKEIVDIFTFHHFDSMMLLDNDKIDPRKSTNSNYDEIQEKLASDVMLAAKRGDVEMLKRLHLTGADLKKPDYDGRTPLHMAVVENQVVVVQYLLRFYPEKDRDSLIKDRWGHTPIDDAIKFNQPVAQMYLEQWFEDTQSMQPKMSLLNTLKPTRGYCKPVVDSQTKIPTIPSKSNFESERKDSKSNVHNNV